MKVLVRDRNEWLQGSIEGQVTEAKRLGHT